MATLILLTPVGLDRGCWDWLDLPEREIVRHEHPGFGSRPRPQRPPDMAQLADEVAATYPGDLDVLGVSMGGMVGQHLAIRHPDRVRSLVMCCTGAFADPSVAQGRAEMAAGGMTDEVMDDTLTRWFTPAALAQGDAHPGVAYARRTLLALAPGAFADGWRSIATHDARPGLPSVRAKVTCIAGRGDAAASLERVGEVAELVPGARLVVLDGPHMIHLEEPQALSAALAEHLRLVEDAAWPASR